MRRIYPYIVPVVLACSSLAWGADTPLPAGDSATSATKPAALRVSGLPAAQWLNVAQPIEGENLQGRLWIVGVLEPWSHQSQRAAAMLADVEKTWSAKGVTAYLLTVAPADQVKKSLPAAEIPLPIGTGSPLPLLLGLDPLPKVYLVGPDQAVVWSGPVWHVAGVLPGYYTNLTEEGLSHERTNELSIRLNRAQAAMKHKEYFLAVGLASTVAAGTPANHPLHRQAEDLLGNLDEIGAGMLASGQHLLSRRLVAEAYDQLQTVAEEFYGTPPAAKAIEIIRQIRANDRQWAEVRRRQNGASAAHTLQMAQAAMASHRYSEARRYYSLILECIRGRRRRVRRSKA